MQLANHNAAWNSKRGYYCYFFGRANILICINIYLGKIGAAFGLKSISAGAKEQLQPYLGKIVPRFYRYKYDPTPKFQNSMCSIWDSIVTDSKETVERHYWAILDELITNLTNTEWRTRISCCLAIRDLIKRPTGLRLRIDDDFLTRIGENSENRMEVVAGSSQQAAADAENEPELLALWTQLFRVMDDVHEGTRLAAEGTAKTLSKVGRIVCNQIK